MLVDLGGDSDVASQAPTLIDSDSDRSDEAVLITDVSFELPQQPHSPRAEGALKKAHATADVDDVRDVASPFRGLRRGDRAEIEAAPMPAWTLDVLGTSRGSGGVKRPQRGKALQRSMQDFVSTKKLRFGSGPTGPRKQDSTLAALRRAERRERSAKLRDGEVMLPPPVVGFSHAVAAKCHTSKLDKGWKVFFPVEPMLPQLQVMNGVLKSLETGGCAFLESPTGTGKTLALLASSLEYQRHRNESWRAAGLGPPPAPAIHQLGDPTPQWAPQIADGSQGQGPAPPPPPPRVVWIARTHEQLQHAIRELRRLPYRPMEALRISRERFCLHPLIQKMPDRAAACELATTTTKQGVMIGGGVTGCEHLDHAEAIGYPNRPEHRQKFEAEGSLAVHDIEDLITEAHATLTCPYHAALDLTGEGAAILLATYPQMLDPCVRLTSSFDAVLKDAVIVIDEAHNLAQAARDAATFRSTLGDMRKLLTDVQGLAEATADPEAVKLAEIVSSALAHLCQWFEEVLSGGAEAQSRSLAGVVRLVEMDEGRELRDADGRGCLGLVGEIMGLQSASNIEKLLRMLKALRKRFIEHGLEGWAVRSSVVNAIDNFLRKMSLVIEEDGRGGFSLLLRRPEVPGANASASIAMLSLRAATAFQAAVKDSHAVLLASGTLAPFPLLAAELGLSTNRSALALDEAAIAIPPVLSLVQVVEAQQTANVRERLLVLPFGAVEGQRLSSTLQHRRASPQGYVDALGKTLATLTAVVPNGTLVFFPSYGQLREAVTRWRIGGLLTSLRDGRELFAGKTAIVESNDLSGEAFAAALLRYRQQAVSSSGAILLAVMRGRCAEGADFKDEAARCVAVVGVPYPALDAEVRLKKDFEQRAGRGSAWYDAEAYRSVSQAAGRLLRHRADYGCLLLLDDRLSGSRPPAQLSGWLRQELAEQRPSMATSSLEAAKSSIEGFFKR
eukprot:CAMPEP_0178389404 /NCGR_PEP_ID=MMETSP0689_2-20121128/10099_1 /TAXON_ID=160604 /ORGANISM="Amphidinium massartii, Strain CS-259" /LENGTH=955 /DNA_ID=CAMNT_0020009853 /DNA_START=57 /DNA_END=2921 /DNA_ORIENTATION=+